MNIRILRQALVVALLSSSYALAAPVQFNVTSTVTVVEGSYVGGVAGGDNINGSFLIDNDSANAGPGSDPGPGTNPGHEYTSFWTFDGAPYGVELFNVQQSGAFGSSTQSVVVNDGLFIDAEETGGLVPTGTYDWLELLGATTVDYCPGGGEPCGPADGEEWTLALFAADDNWFSGGDIPDTLPNDFTAFLIGFEFNEFGEETGLVIAPLDSLTLAPVPLPAAFWLFASSLGALGVVRRARQR